VTAEILKKLATIALEFIKDFEPSIQHSILKKFLNHFMLQNEVFEYLIDVQSIKQNQEILNNMKSRFTSHLVGPKQTQVVVARDIVCIFASSSSIGSSRGVAKVLGG
jgi:hypothetical protein